MEPADSISSMDRNSIERKGFLGMLTNGFAGSKTISMSSIQNIQLIKLVHFLMDLGGVEKQQGLTGAIDDENSVVFLEECNQKTENFSVADEILKLKQLVDMGILMQDEFDAKKKQLLGI